MNNNNNKTLYRKYRPSNFNEVAGHKNIITILKNEIINNKIPHAIMFAGQRGTGKTSIARIFSKIINCTNRENDLRCYECESCLLSNIDNNPDIVEIDAASNNGVNEIREIKNKVNSIQPIVSQHRIYIIDEVHMLTIQAFNALLKTLEEPPKNTFFILATTEIHKIPKTIISRCQIFTFNKIEQDAVIEKLNFIVQNEGFNIETKILKEIYNYSDGSLRDAINIVEQLISISNENKITQDDFDSILSYINKEDKIKILKYALDYKGKEIINFLEELNNKNSDFDFLLINIIGILKEIIIVKTTNNLNFLKQITEEEFDQFKNYNINNLFELTNELVKIYEKTRNTNIVYSYLIISILRFINKNNSNNLKINDKTSNNKTSNDKTSNDKTSNDKTSNNKTSNDKTSNNKTSNDKNIILKKESRTLEESKQENKIIDENLDHTNNKKDIKSENNDLVKKTNKKAPKNAEIKSTTRNSEILDKISLKEKIQYLENELCNYETNFKYNYDENLIYNLLTCAHSQREITEEIQKKVLDIFEVDENEQFKNKKLVNELFFLYDKKILCASKNAILIKCEHQNESLLVQKLSIEDNVIKSLKQIFNDKDYLVLSINSIHWENIIKPTFKEMKKNKSLKEYIEEDVNEIRKKINCYTDNNTMDKIFETLGSDIEII